MARFAVQLLLPDLAWDLLADLEPILRSAKERQSHVVEVLDRAGTFESEGIESARTQSAKRGHPPNRITLTVTGYAGPANAPQRRREHTVSVWASGLTQAGAAVNGHTTGGGAHATSYAEGLLGELDGQVRAFLRHHYIPAHRYIPADLLEQDPHQPELPPAEAAPGIPARGLGSLLRIITHQPLAATIIGSTIAGVLAAIIIAWLT